MTRGRFITLEGIEGAGKSTIAAYLRDWLTASGVAVRLTREPGGTRLGERIRDVVLARDVGSIMPVSETLLMFAARATHLNEVIRPALERGEWIVCDRFTDATRAYQGAGRGVDPRLIEQLAAFVHGDLHPDRTLLLDVPVATGLSRARQRLFAADRFEGEEDAFFERARAEYLAIARREPARVRVIDAGRGLADVEAQVVAAVSSLADGGR
ncbi:MAG: dTMP kinase [Gammaproteobacteria bacterium]